MSWNNKTQFSIPSWNGNNVFQLGNQLNISSINTNYISTGTLEGSNVLLSSINGVSFSNIMNQNSNADLSKWSQFKAISNIVGITNPLVGRVIDILDINDIHATNLTLTQNTINPIGGMMKSFALQTSFSAIGDATATKLIVNGPTTLDGGTIHGTSIGSLPVGGINTVRVDVLPIGIDIISPTYVTIDSTTANIATAGATSIASGGALSLAAGSYIEYNTDQNYFINTSAGNDYTDIYVGNIHGANKGSQPLSINENRGVTLDTIVHLNLNDNSIPSFWANNTFYDTNAKVLYGPSSDRYISIFPNRDISPSNALIKIYNSNREYFKGNVITYLSPSNYYYATVDGFSNITPTCNTIIWNYLSNGFSESNYWTRISNYPNSFVKGDEKSFVSVGAVSTINISSFEVYAASVYTEHLGQPNALVRTPININNDLNMLENTVRDMLELFVQTIYVSTIHAYAINASNIYIDSNFVFSNVNAQTINTTDLSFSNLKTDVNCEDHIFFSTLAMTFTDVLEPTSNQGLFFYSSFDHPVILCNSSITPQGYLFNQIPFIIPDGNSIVTVENKLSIYNTTNTDVPYSGLFTNVDGIFSYNTFSNDGTLLSSRRIVDDWSIAQATNDLNIANYNLNNVAKITTHDIQTNYIRNNSLGYTIVQTDLLFTNLNNIMGVNSIKTIDLLTNNLCNYGTVDNIKVQTDLDFCNNNISNVNNLQLINVNNTPYDVTSNFAKYRAVSNLNMNNCNILNANNLSVVTINNSPYDATSNFAKYSAVSNLNMNNCNILNVSNINLTNINGVAYSPFSKVTGASFTFSNITIASNTAVQNIINNCNITLEPNTLYQMNLAMNISNIPTANWNLVCRIGKTTVGTPIFYQLTAINPTFNYLCQGATGSFYTDDATNYTMRIFVGNTSTSNNITINRIVESIHKMP